MIVQKRIALLLRTEVGMRKHSLGKRKPSAFSDESGAVWLDSMILYDYLFHLYVK